RERLDAVQRELRSVRGVSVLVYDQTCATEVRRRRRRGMVPVPARHVFINTAVCEGCGDCSLKSNCLSVDEAYSLLIAGAGGTGVVTLGALIGMAAHLEGKGVTVLDQTGLSQKGGAVLTHVRIAADPGVLHAPRIVRADLLLGCDLLVAASPETLQ